MKKQHNDFDDFLRRKEEEFDIPFKEEYWEQASAYIQANRYSIWTKLFNKSLLWSSALILIIGGVAASLYFFNHQRGNPDKDIVIATSEQSTQTDSESSANNTSVNNISSNVEMPKSVNQHAETSTDINSNYSSATIKGVKKTYGSNLAETQLNQQSKSVSPSKNHKSDNNKISNTIGTVKLNTENIQRNDIYALNSHNSYFFKSSGIPAVPVFENMTIADNTIPVFYGLPYLSKVQSSSSRKIREFSRGGLYPQLTISLSGGVNIFNTFKESTKADGFISTNPFLGVRASYQMNSKWIIAAQLNAIQRGGINQRTNNPIEFIDKNRLTRQLYAVQLPVTAGYFLNKKNSIALGAAPMFTVMSSESSFNINNNDFNKSIQFTTPNGLNRFDIQAVVAYSYRLNKKININAVYQHGFTDVTKQGVFTNDLKHNNHFASLGLTFNLTQQKIKRK